jgi:hypothetical protein
MRCVLLHWSMSSTGLARSGGEPRECSESASRGSTKRVFGEMIRSGVLLASEDLLPDESGVRVRTADGGVTVMEGPFADAGGRIARLTVLQVRTSEEAIEWARRFLVAMGEGETEVRPLSDAPSAAA